MRTKECPPETNAVVSFELKDPQQENDFMYLLNMLSNDIYKLAKAQQKQTASTFLFI